MRIIQLIDTLEMGGAEKMAVNFANALTETKDFSGMVVSRKEGKLKESLVNKAHYLFLGRKKIFDFKAVFRLRAYCKKNKIDYIQAHGTSFFLAFLVKLVFPGVKILFHDHSGARSLQKIANNRALWLASFFFEGIIVVNHPLEIWAKQHLNCKKVVYLPNFTTVDDSHKATLLKGLPGKKVLLLANLRHPKNHQFLIEVAIKTKASHPDWTFHLVGNDSNDTYSQKLKAAIASHDLQQNVFVYGQKDDTAHIISQSDICVLTSYSEGLPVALLEYGLLKKAVVATNVGEIPLLVVDRKSGFTHKPTDVEGFYESVVKLMDNSALRINFGEALFETIRDNHSQEAVMANYLNWLNEG